MRPARSAGPSTATAREPVEVALAVLLAAAVGVGMHLTRHHWFWVDDWRLVEQSTTAGGLVEQYNGHLSILILGLYRGSVELFGWSFTPLRAASLLALVAVPAAYHLTTRRFLGPRLAALFAASILWAHGTELLVAALNHYLALLGGIACAAALNRGRRADPVLAVALTLSLVAAGGGVAVAVACGVHNLCTRAPWRRWAVVVVPSGLWALWWLFVNDYDRPDFGAQEATPGDALRFAVDLTAAAFGHLGFGLAGLGAVIAGAYAAHAAWRLRLGLDASANLLAWAGAQLVWGVALAQSRGPLAVTDAFRYQVVALGFLLLSVVPRTPRPLPSPGGQHERGERVRRWAAVVVLVGVVGLHSVELWPDLRADVRQLDEVSARNRGTVQMVVLGPEVVPDDESWFDLGGFSAGELRSLFARFGPPASSDPARVDPALAALGLVRLEPAPPEASAGCDGRRSPFTRGWDEPPLVLRAPAEGTDVSVRRTGEAWVLIGRLAGDEAATVVLPMLSVDSPWEVRADGACAVAH
jgi:hypothetical protein